MDEYHFHLLLEYSLARPNLCIERATKPAKAMLSMLRYDKYIGLDEKV